MSRFREIDAQIIAIAGERQRLRDLQANCEHDFDPDEGFHCLNCGKDGTEEVMSKAYDRQKDRRKYGD